MPEERPPYVTFDVRAVEDRDASIKAGSMRSKDVVYALITPTGSRDRVEKVADDWIKDLEYAVQQERIPSQWLDHFRRAYEAYKDNQELPETGTAIKLWPAISPAQSVDLLALNIRTVEDVAGMGESAMGALGLGARALKDRASAWLKAAEGPGKTSELIASLQLQITELSASLENRDEKLKELQTQIVALTTDKAQT